MGDKSEGKDLFLPTLVLCPASGKGEQPLRALVRHLGPARNSTCPAHLPPTVPSDNSSSNLMIITTGLQESSQ